MRMETTVFFPQLDSPTMAVKPPIGNAKSIFSESHDPFHRRSTGHRSGWSSPLGQGAPFAPSQANRSAGISYPTPPRRPWRCGRSRPGLLKISPLFAHRLPKTEFITRIPCGIHHSPCTIVHTSRGHCFPSIIHPDSQHKELCREAHFEILFPQFEKQYKKAKKD